MKNLVQSLRIQNIHNQIVSFSICATFCREVLFVIRCYCWYFNKKFKGFKHNRFYSKGGIRVHVNFFIPLRIKSACFSLYGLVNSSPKRTMPSPIASIAISL